MSMVSWFAGLGALIALTSFALITARSARKSNTFTVVEIERVKR